MASQKGKAATAKDAKGKPEKNYTTRSSYSSREYDTKANGNASVVEMKPITPARKPKNIVAGMAERMRRFAGRATKLISPIL